MILQKRADKNGLYWKFAYRWVGSGKRLVLYAILDRQPEHQEVELDPRGIEHREMRDETCIKISDGNCDYRNLVHRGCDR